MKTSALMLLAQLQQLETEFHHPGVQCSAQRLEELLHPGFHEVGRSGRPYDRATVISYLASAPSAQAFTESWAFVVQALGAESALLTYQSAQRTPSGKLSNHTHRSSIWLQGPQGWQVFYHQGTPAAGEPEPIAH
jgi:hypothetical protein